MNIYAVKLLLLSLLISLMTGCMHTADLLDFPEAFKTFNKDTIGQLPDSAITYEYWKLGGAGSMYVHADGTFAVEWYRSGFLPNNLLARTGIRPGNNVNGVSYAVDYNPQGTSFMCIYGWNQSETLIEYYIVDNWHPDWRPPGNTGEYKRTVTIDDVKYDIYTSIRKNKPSIRGNTTFIQYWSVRQKPRSAGYIDVKKHFDAWAETKGMISLESLYEVSFCIEGVNSSGSADVKKLEFIFD